MSLTRMVECAVFSGVVVFVGSVSADVIMRLVPAEVDLPPGDVGDEDVEVTLVGAVVHTSIDVGDSDLDGDIDLLDARDLQNCFTGSGGGVPEGCEAMDLDADDDVDLIDHTIWATMMTGPG